MSMPAPDRAHLEAVLRNVADAGVYHMPQMDKADLIGAAEADGHTVFRVDLANVRDKHELLVAIGQTMGFPEWFGQNFDALADCLGDLGWRPADGYVILLEHCDGIHGRAEEDFATTLQVFEQAAEEWRDQGLPFWCLVEMQADGIAWLPTGP